MTGIAYATSAEMAGELGAFPGFAENREADAARHPQPSPRRAWRSARLRGARRSAPVPLDAANCPDPGASSRRRAHAWDARAGAGRAARLPQCPGHGDRADRHDRPRHGLRHHRHRARLRARQVQEARRRRLFQDHQPHRARGAARARLRRRADRGDHALRGRPRHARRTRPASTTTRSRPRASPTARSRRSRAALAAAFDIKFAFNKWTLGEEFCKAAFGFTDEQLDDVGFDLLARARLHQGRDRGRQHLLLRRHDARRRAASSRTSICRSSIAPTRAAASASASSRSTATSA